MEKTNKQFWEKFWQKIKLPERVNYSFKNDRVVGETIRKYLPHGNMQHRMVEIGCAPGKWLVFFFEKMSYLVTGIEYLPIAAKKTEENLLLNNVPLDSFTIINQDFNKIRNIEKHDVVFSHGFIEHFDDYEMVLEKQMEMLTEDGYLIVGVPNFRYINNFLAGAIDPYLREKTMPAMNCNSMKKTNHLRFAKNHGLEVVYCDYVGGFEPSLFNFNAIPHRCVRWALTKLAALLSSKPFQFVNSGLISGYLISIFKKRGDKRD